MLLPVTKYSPPKIAIIANPNKVNAKLSIIAAPSLAQLPAGVKEPILGWITTPEEAYVETLL